MQIAILLVGHTDWWTPAFAEGEAERFLHDWGSWANAVQMPLARSYRCVQREGEFLTWICYAQIAALELDRPVREGRIS